MDWLHAGYHEGATIAALKHNPGYCPRPNPYTTDTSVALNFVCPNYFDFKRIIRLKDWIAQHNYLSQAQRDFCLRLVRKYYRQFKEEWPRVEQDLSDPIWATPLRRFDPEPMPYHIDYDCKQFRIYAPYDERLIAIYARVQNAGLPARCKWNKEEHAHLVTNCPSGAEFLHLLSKNMPEFSVSARAKKRIQGFLRDFNKDSAPIASMIGGELRVTNPVSTRQAKLINDILASHVNIYNKISQLTALLVKFDDSVFSYLSKTLSEFEVCMLTSMRWTVAPDRIDEVYELVKKYQPESILELASSKKVESYSSVRFPECYTLLSGTDVQNYLIEIGACDEDMTIDQILRLLSPKQGKTEVVWPFREITSSQISAALAGGGPFKISSNRRSQIKTIRGLDLVIDHIYADRTNNMQISKYIQIECPSPAGNVMVEDSPRRNRHNRTRRIR